MRFLIIVSTICSIYSISHARQYAWDGKKIGPKLTKYTQEALEDFGDFLLETRESGNLTATGDICPEYNRMSRRERIEFYTALIAEIAQRESSFRPGAIGDEAKFKGGDITGLSLGLLQLDYNHAKNSYKCENIKNKKSLLNARTNIRCAVKMMNHLVKRDGLLRNNTSSRSDSYVGSLLIKGKNKLRTEDTSDLKWLGLADFWSPLRFEFWKDRAKLTRPYFSKGKVKEKEKARSVERIRTRLQNKDYCKSKRDEPFFLERPRPRPSSF